MMDFFKRNSKKVLMSLVCLFACATMHAQTIDWNKLITAIATVESTCNPNAKNGKHFGYLQISPILVKDCNEYLEKKGLKKRYTHQDALNKNKSIEMFRLYQERHNPKNDLHRAICIWNAGAFYKKAPYGYLRKVLNVYSKL